MAFHAAVLSVTFTSAAVTASRAASFTVRQTAVEANTATSASAAADKGDAAAIAIVVQNIQELCEAIDDLGANPLQPLGAGGVGRDVFGVSDLPWMWCLLHPVRAD